MIISRCGLLIVLTLTVGLPSAFADSLVCHPIQRGETATQLAQRITGDARNKYQPWFQIVDSATRFVPKSQYNLIRPGWRACIIKESVESRSKPALINESVDSRSAPALIEESIESRSAPANRVEAASSPVPSTTDWLRVIGGIDLTVVWLGAAVVVPWIGWRILDDYVGRRRTVSIVMRHFADRFVREFERPLIQQHAAERPVRARVRLHPRRARLEIFLAPGTGRRYPNLSDHKKNVEYDVVRVLHLLADDSFVRDPLYTQAGWVVVPLHFKAGSKRSGVTCISSL